MERSGLLTGSIYKHLTVLAFPLLLGNILQQLYNTVDSLIIGRILGTEAFAAVGVAGTIMNLLLFILSGFAIGVSVIFAHLYGAGDLEGFRKEVFTALIFGSILTLLISWGALFGTGPLLKLLRTPEELLSDADRYLEIVLSGLPLAYLYNLFSNILRSIGNTKAPLYFLLGSMALNIGLDCLLVIGFSWGISGAALATVLAQGAAAAGCFFYLKRQYRDLLCKKRDVGIHGSLVKKTLWFGMVSALQESSLYLGKLLVQGKVNTLGTAAIAAYTATIRVEGLANSFGDSGCQAEAIFVSQNFGAGKQKRVRGAFRKSLVLHVLLGLTISLVMFAAAGMAMKLFFDESGEQAFADGVSYLRIVSLVYVLNFIGSSLVGYLKGVGQMTVPFIGTTLNISIRVILSWLFLEQGGLTFLAWATGIGWGAIVAYLAMYCFFQRFHKNHPA